MNDPFKLTNPYTKPTKGNQKSKKSPNNFLEAFKDQGQALTSGLVNDTAEQLFGFGSANNFPADQDENQAQKPVFNFAEFLKNREEKIRMQERNMAQEQRRIETTLYSSKKREEEQQIEALKAEIKKIIKLSKGMGAKIASIDQATMANTVAYGVYQKNFFQRILNLLVIIRKQLSESSSWLNLFNQRKSQKSGYWAGVARSGSKFMISHERYAVTQTG